jgi:hypothetical protein
MLPMALTDATRQMKPPSDWQKETQGECLTLDIHDHDDGNGNNMMISAWQLQEGELEKLAKGAPIFLRIYGTNHPVVSLFAGDPTDVGPPN